MSHGSVPPETPVAPPEAGLTVPPLPMAEIPPEPTAPPAAPVPSEVDGGPSLPPPGLQADIPKSNEAIATRGNRFTMTSFLFQDSSIPRCAQSSRNNTRK
jgi:hypothetical protein